MSLMSCGGASSMCKLSWASIEMFRVLPGKRNNMPSHRSASRRFSCMLRPKSDDQGEFNSPSTLTIGITLRSSSPCDGIRPSITSNRTELPWFPDRAHSFISSYCYRTQTSMNTIDPGLAHLDVNPGRTAEPHLAAEEEPWNQYSSHQSVPSPQATHLLSSEEERSGFAFSDLPMEPLFASYPMAPPQRLRVQMTPFTVPPWPSMLTNPPDSDVTPTQPPVSLKRNTVATRKPLQIATEENCVCTPRSIPMSSTLKSEVRFSDNPFLNHSDTSSDVWRGEEHGVKGPAS